MPKIQNSWVIYPVITVYNLEIYYFKPKTIIEITVYDNFQCFVYCDPIEIVFPWHEIINTDDFGKLIIEFVDKNPSHPGVDEFLKKNLTKNPIKEILI